MISALRHPKIFRLWLGQALSSIGDEIYRVGLTWLAVGLIGADTGYISASQAAALMLLSFVGGKWADNWDSLQTMVRVDLVRAGIVLIPVAYSFYAPVPLPLLVGVAVTLSGLGAFFDPALQTALPRFLPAASQLRGATGLMATTIRLARMVGPAVVGFLAGVIPQIHFFSLDALTFLVSALSVGSLRKLEARDIAAGLPQPPARVKRRISFHEAIAEGFRSVRRVPGMRYVVFAKAISGGTWNLAFTLGFALLLQELAPNDTRKFAMVIATYGLGNIIGAVCFGSLRRRRSGLMMFTGFILMGIGFVVVALAPEISWIMGAAMFAGFSGPMGDLPFADMVQARFPIAEMGRVFRLRMALDTALTLALMLMAPWLFRTLSVRPVIGLCGLASVVMGIAGLIWHAKKLGAMAPEPPEAVPTVPAVPAVPRVAGEPVVALQASR